MRILAVIPARYASSRFPGKPLADMGGKPMIQRVYERVASRFDHTVAATDDARIFEAVRGFGGNVVMTSADHRSGTDRCRECLDIYSASAGTEFDVVVNVQGDEPFVSDEHLSLLSAAFDDPHTAIATLVKKFGPGEDIFNPNIPKVAVGREGRALYFSRSPIPYLRGEEREGWQGCFDYYKHIGLYAYRTEVLREITALEPGRLEAAESLEQLRWLENGYGITVRETAVETLAVDTPEDLRKALSLLQ